MTEYDHSAHLKAGVHAQRKANTYQKVDKLLKGFYGLTRILILIVSSKAGVSKATLYNNQDILERIETL